MTPRKLNMAILLFLWCAFVLKVSGQVYEYEPSYETLGLENLRKTSGNFSWENCDNTHPLIFTHVSMEPDPLRLTGDDLEIIVSLGFNLTMMLGDNGDKIEVDLSLRLKTADGYTEICELVGESICHYNDLCSVLKNLTKQCEQFRVPCKCPFKPEPFNTPRLRFANFKPLPFLLSGTFEATVFIKQQGKHVGCLDIHFCVTKCLF